MSASVRRWVGSHQRRLQQFHAEGLNRLGRGPSPTHEPAGPVVSLTTHGARLAKAHLTIESILRGQHRPAELHLWLAREEIQDEQLPCAIERLRERGIQVTFVDKNFRPANKLVHALSVYPGRQIVVADDDIWYPRYWLSRLLKAADSTPDAIVAHRAHTLEVFDDGTLGQYRDAASRRTGNMRPSYLMIATGTSGVLYPPGSLHASVHDLNLYNRTAQTVDDVWFKIMSILAKTPTRQVHDGLGLRFPNLPGSQTVALGQVNGPQGRNDLALAELTDHFMIDWAVLT